MHFLTSNFNLLETNSGWNSLKKEKFNIDPNFDNFGLAILNKNFLDKYSSIHTIIYINEYNFKDSIFKIKKLKKNFSKNPSKYFFFYFFVELSSKESKFKKLLSHLHNLRNEKNENFLTNIFFPKKNDNFFSKRNLKYLKFPFDINSINFIKKQVIEKKSKLNLKPYKLLILDCDNTLWGGVLDEDKNSEIYYSNDGQGLKFKEFQEYLKKLKNKGILLSLCSKNNEKKVWKFFKKKQMELQKRDFIYSEINWEEKSKNINQIVKSLDLRYEDCMFIDDNIVEIKKVKNTIKKINTFHLENIKKFQTLINNDIRFSHLIPKKNGNQKFRQYKLRFKFKEFVRNTELDKNTLKDLKQKVKIFQCSNSTFSRAEELFNKTNQFNFSLNRHNKEKIIEILKSKNHELKLFSLSDKFGDHGIIGIYVIKKEKSKVIISDFCLSCRVLSRFVEDFVLVNIFLASKGKNCEIIYKKTNKNSNLIPKFLKKKFFTLQNKNKNEYNYKLRFNNKYINEIKKIFKN